MDHVSKEIRSRIMAAVRSVSSGALSFSNTGFNFKTRLTDMPIT